MDAVLQTLLNFDQQLFIFIFQKCQSEMLDGLLRFFYTSPYAVILTLLLVLLILRGYFKEYRYKGILLFFVTVLQLSLVDKTVSPLKAVSQRQRPEFSLTSSRVEPRLKSETSYSFPSGHAVDAFYLAVLTGLLVPSLRISLGGLALLVCLSRVYGGLHYPSDVAFGAFYGAVLAWLTFKLESPLLKRFFTASGKDKFLKA